ncbi:MAG: adenylate/guanylate cyclase domain-containing protein, partial [Hyphomicrobiaceae bacterium]
MSESITPRIPKLAAVMCADVVGYSRLMGEDSAKTLSALRKFRSDALGPIVSDHSGQVVKSMGDGWLIVFYSVVDSVRCATRLQIDLTENPTIKLRIGLHLGDIAIEEDDIFGDGVNIAARLQDLADPGGVVISDLAWRSLDRKRASTFTDLGVHHLKNIVEPVGLFGWGTTSVTPQVDVPPSNQFSIVVMPFHNLSHESEQEYFVDGITEDIISELTKIPELLVIARNSSFEYKRKSVPVKDVCRKLGVKYVLEGNVRKSGPSLRIGTQLIDGVLGSQLWSERYDRRLEDVFAVQDDVTGKIVQALEVRLLGDLRAGFPQKPTHNSEAYDYVLRAREQYRFFSQDQNASARELYKNAIALDPSYGEAYA